MKKYFFLLYFWTVLKLFIPLYSDILFTIQWPASLCWEVHIGGSKNAALPIIAASLLVPGKTILHNVPAIGDVFTFLDILSDIGVVHTFVDNCLTLDASQLYESGFDFDKIKKIRVSILLLAPLLTRLWKIQIPMPGGCYLWKRPIDSHLEGLKNIGYKYDLSDDLIQLHGQLSGGDLHIDAGFGVTSTENLIVANVLRSWTTTISLTAGEPHVMNLVDFLNSLWADITLGYNNTITVRWVTELHPQKQDFSIVSDYIQSGTYMIMGALSAEKYIDIHNACYEDLYSFRLKLQEAWVEIEKIWTDSVRVYKAKKITPVSIQTNIFPWFPTDLQSPFSVLMTQAAGVSKIHEVLFEQRLNFLVELEKMHANVALMNPHQALIFGPSKLSGTTVTSWDLRAWAAMVLAGLIAEGETKITNVEYIHRGYEDLVKNLSSLGANIKEID